MPKLFPYMHVENFLSDELSQQIFDYAAENEDKYTPSLVGKEGKVNEKMRISKVTRDLGPFDAVLHEKIHAFYPEMLMGLKMADFKKKEQLELEIAAHGDGAFFKPHIDMRLGETGDRVLSAVYYMHSIPKKFSGGELKIYPLEIMPGDDEPVVLEPKHNSLLIFQSYVHHEVLPIVCPGAAFRDYRFAINCWIHKA